MGAGLHDFALIHHEDPVCRGGGRQLMGDEEDGFAIAAFSQIV